MDLKQRQDTAEFLKRWDTGELFYFLERYRNPTEITDNPYEGMVVAPEPYESLIIEELKVRMCRFSTGIPEA